ncbi:MOSC domain-containing protein [Gordonia otitidis]|uniref:MOSC domain-containing protein n=1 Tax=Gordonia otitidis TaxID=249058 RepID=UPI001D157579|nr:MOSC domain-containing protein [Gordonia otitidis]UEA60221.1 MOSC domain-containing protein [Gordonia otitidis]
MSEQSPSLLGHVIAVCVADHDVDLPSIGASAIDKRPQQGRVMVGAEGLVTDHVCDTKHHGGVDQAVYAYDHAEAHHWAATLGRELPYGWFGENLRVTGLPVTDALVGEQWAIGDDGLLLETTIPRTPCRTFAVWADETKWIKRFHDRGDVGTYLRVLRPGTVGAGDDIRVVHRPDHRVRVRHLITGTDADSLRELLAIDDLAPKVRREATKKLARA